VARAGDVLEDPQSGDRLVFLRTAAETGGDLLEYELTFTPRGFAARDHLHPRQSERHEVLDGSLGLVAAARRGLRPPCRVRSSRRSPCSAARAACVRATRSTARA
jgi:hypothetical protein